MDKTCENRRHCSWFLPQEAAVTWVTCTCQQTSRFFWDFLRFSVVFGNCAFSFFTFFFLSNQLNWTQSLISGSKRNENFSSSRHKLLKCLEKLEKAQQQNKIPRMHPRILPFHEEILCGFHCMNAPFWSLLPLVPFNVVLCSQFFFFQEVYFELWFRTWQLFCAVNTGKSFGVSLNSAHLNNMTVYATITQQTLPGCTFGCRIWPSFDRRTAKPTPTDGTHPFFWCWNFGQKGARFAGVITVHDLPVLWNIHRPRRLRLGRAHAARSSGSTGTGVRTASPCKPGKRAKGTYQRRLTWAFCLI